MKLSFKWGFITINALIAIVSGRMAYLMLSQWLLGSPMQLKPEAALVYFIAFVIMVFALGIIAGVFVFNRGFVVRLGVILTAVLSSSLLFLVHNITNHISVQIIFILSAINLFTLFAIEKNIFIRKQEKYD